MASRRWRTMQPCAEPICPHTCARGLASSHSHSKTKLSTTPIPLTRAASTDCGECINGLIARPRGATRRVPGGSATTNTRNDGHLVFVLRIRNLEGANVPSMQRKHSSDGRRSWIRRRNSGGVHRQVQKSSQSERSQSVSENKGEMIWQQAKRETRSNRKGISR